MAMKLSYVAAVLLLLGHVSVARAEQNPVLSTRRIEAHPCVIGPGNSVKETVTVGTTVSRSLGDSGTCQTSGPGYYFDFYAFPAHAFQHLRVTYTTGFDSPLISIQETTEVTPLSSIGLTREGRLDYKIFPNPGTNTVTYYLVVGGAAPGDYTLQISEVPADTCSNTTAVCLGTNSRFKVQAVWTANGTSGQASAIRMTTDTGYFWFFSNGNVEMVVKVVDGRAFNNKFWVFAGGLTNVDVTLTVTDTQTGTVNTYRNLANTAFQPIQDTAGFDGSATPARDVNIAGVWDVVIDYTTNKPRKIVTFGLSQTGNSVSGFFADVQNGRAGTINGTISGQRFDFSVVSTFDSCQFTFSATVNSTGDQMTGTTPGTSCVDPFTLSGNKR